MKFGLGSGFPHGGGGNFVGYFAPGHISYKKWHEGQFNFEVGGVIFPVTPGCVITAAGNFSYMQFCYGDNRQTVRTQLVDCF